MFANAMECLQNGHKSACACVFVGRFGRLFSLEENRKKKCFVQRVDRALIMKWRDRWTDRQPILHNNIPRPHIPICADWNVSKYVLVMTSSARSTWLAPSSPKKELSFSSVEFFLFWSPLFKNTHLSHNYHPSSPSRKFWNNKVQQGQT